MKLCPKCGAQVDEQAQFCTSCGFDFATMEQSQDTQPYAPQYYMPWDHTDEFSPRDIQENKVICMLLYLNGLIGVLIATLLQRDSAYVAFHLRQALKFMVVEALLVFLGVLLAFTVIVPIAVGICHIVLAIVKIICFFQICENQAKEPPIIRSLGFLK